MRILFARTRRLRAWMTDEARTIARTARRLGYRAVTLGQATDQHWQALRVILGAEDASDLTLADAVDVLLRYETDPDRVTVEA